MDKQEAKLILSNHTLGKQPTEDERFAAAMALAETDEELAAWWQAQKQTDEAMSRALKRFEVPADLRSALQMTMDDRQRKQLRFTRARNWLSIAAVLALGLGLFLRFGVDRSDDYIGPLAQRAFDYSVDGPWLTYFNRDTSSLKSWLVENGFQMPDKLPPKLLALEGIGCRPLDWSDQRVALMCFNADSVYHLFIAKEQDFPDFDASAQIGYASKEEGWTVSKWKDQEHLFVLTAKTTVDEMSQFLANYEIEASEVY